MSGVVCPVLLWRMHLPDMFSMAGYVQYPDNKETTVILPTYLIYKIINRLPKMYPVFVLSRLIPFLHHPTHCIALHRFQNMGRQIIDYE